MNMLGDRWGTDVTLNLSANEAALRQYVSDNWPDFLVAADSYARLYSMTLTNAMRFVLGVSGSGYSDTMREAILLAIENVEAGKSPHQGSALDSPSVRFAIGAAVVAVLLFAGASK